MVQSMTLSFLKLMFSVIRNAFVCFFSVVENMLTQLHIQLAARKEFVI